MVWLITLNCLGACMLPLPAVGEGSRLPLGEARVVQLDGGPRSGAPPGEEACDEAVTAAHLDAADLLATLDLPLEATRDHLRAEHFCALYGCLTTDADPLR